jgi:PTH1 family peptidyl-tRNA hydrolase
MNRIVVFLGNPGIQYRKTRHNVAWLLCDYLNLSGQWRTKFHGEFLKDGETVWLKPQTFMNVSGQSVIEAATFFDVPAERILVVHDDIETAFGRVMLRQGGGMAGHNGLRSVKQHLSSDNFFRLRLGIGRPQNAMQVSSFVLNPFTQLEEAQLDAMFVQAEQLLNTFTGART